MNCTSTQQIYYPRLTGAVCICFTALFMLCGCPGYSAPRSQPEGIDLLTEGFGTAIHLLMTEDQARSAGMLPGTELWLLAAEDLIGRNPYTERSAGSSLMVAAISEYSTRDVAPESPVVTEIRIYPAEENSVFSFAGKALNQLDPADLEEYLGPADSNAGGSDGNIHVTFRLAVDKAGNTVVNLTTSHYVGGGCFALKLKLEQPAP